MWHSQWPASSEGQSRWERGHDSAEASDLNPATLVSATAQQAGRSGHSALNRAGLVPLQVARFMIRGALRRAEILVASCAPLQTALKVDMLYSTRQY